MAQLCKIAWKECFIGLADQMFAMRLLLTYGLTCHFGDYDLKIEK